MPAKPLYYANPADFSRNPPDHSIAFQSVTTSVSQDGEHDASSQLREVTSQAQTPCPTTMNCTSTSVFGFNPAAKPFSKSRCSTAVSSTQPKGFAHRVVRPSNDLSYAVEERIKDSVETPLRELVEASCRVIREEMGCTSSALRLTIELHHRPPRATVSFAPNTATLNDPKVLANMLFKVDGWSKSRMSRVKWQVFELTQVTAESIEKTRNREVMQGRRLRFRSIWVRMGEEAEVCLKFMTTTYRWGGMSGKSTLVADWRLLETTWGQG